MASLMAFLIASLRIDQEKAVLTRCHAILAAGEMTRSTLVRTFPTLEPTLISIIRPPIRFDTSATGVDVDIDALTDAQLDAADTALGAPAAAAATAATAAAVDGAPDEFSLPSPPAPPPSRNESVDSVDSDALTDELTDAAQAEAADTALDTALATPVAEEDSLPLPPAPPPSRSVSRSEPRNVASLQLLVVAHAIPRKSLGVVLRALGAARGHGLKHWTLRIVGSVTADAAHAAELNTTRIALGLHSSQVEWLGDVDEARLAMLYREASVVFVSAHCEHFCNPAQEAAFFGVPVLAFDVGEHANFGDLAPVADERAFTADERAFTADERAFTAEIERLLREPARLDAMRRAARASAAAIHEQLRSTAKASLTEEEEPLDTALPPRAVLHLAMGRRAAAERLDARARWRDHLRWSRGPVLLSVSVQIALLVFVRIRYEASALDVLIRQRSDVSALDVALDADAVLGALVVTNGTRQCPSAVLSAAYAIAVAALPFGVHAFTPNMCMHSLPAALAFGVPLASSVWIWLPWRLTQRPPLHARPWAVSALCVGSALSVVATHTLHACLASAATTGSGSSDVGVPASMCMHSLSLWTRHLINLSTIVVAGYARSSRSRTRSPV
jgi:glycosyltransferase involved in cell wall biosynthesis